MRTRIAIASFVAAAVAIAALQTLFRSSSGASIILTIAYWKAISEGAVALAATAELTSARWIRPIKKTLFSFYPIILLTTLLTALLATRFDIYPWVGAEGIWLNKWIFLGRNVGASLLTFVLAWRLAADPGGLKSGRGSLLVAYLLAFVLSQSLLAFDLVMSLEHPWISTLFGGYFFVEAVFSGMAVAGLLCFFRIRFGDPDLVRKLSVTLNDVATLIFGFSLLWAGLFYSQFLVIWYGNIPEEAEFLVHRLSDSPLREMSHFVLGATFVLPFLILLSRKAKHSPAAVLAASVVVLCGVLVERIVFLAPVARLNPALIVPEFVILGFFAYVLVQRGRPKARV